MLPAEIALRYTSAVVERCESLGTLPHRGTPRDDIRPGLRTTTYKRRTVIAYSAEADQVSVIGVFHGARITNRNCSLNLTLIARAIPAVERVDGGGELSCERSNARRCETG